jgi:hypothetical protein
MRFDTYLPVFGLFIGSGLGLLVAEAAGWPDWVGGVGGAVIGVVGTVAALRYRDR